MNNVIFTKATIYRNLKDYKFVPKLDQEKTQEIEEKVGSSLGSVFHKIDLSSADIGVVTYLKDNALIGKNTKIGNTPNELNGLLRFEHVCKRG